MKNLAHIVGCPALRGAGPCTRGCVDAAQDMTTSAMLAVEYEARIAALDIYERELESSFAADWYYALGIAGEVGEVVDKFDKRGLGLPITKTDIALELGDVLWYVTRLAAREDISLTSLFSWAPATVSSHIERDLIRNMGEVADKIKKRRRDKRPELRAMIVSRLSLLVQNLIVLAAREGYSIHQIMWMNVDKLERRRERGTQRGDGDNR